MTNIEQVKEDVVGFVNNPHDLDIWSNDYFLQLADTYTYDSYGNVTGMSAVSGAMMWSRTGIGSYEYGTSSKPHAVTAVDNTSGIIPEHTQSVTYNAWGKVSEISYVSGGDTYQYTITYGPDVDSNSKYPHQNH